MTPVQEVLEQLAKVECNRLTTDLVFQRREYTNRMTFLVTYEIATVTKLGGRVVVDLREVDRRSM